MFIMRKFPGCMACKLLVFLILPSYIHGFEFRENWFSDPLLMSPVRYDELQGALIAKFSNEKTVTPLFYPNIVSIIERMDHADPELITLSELLDNPSLRIIHQKSSNFTNHNPTKGPSLRGFNHNSDKNSHANKVGKDIVSAVTPPITLPGDKLLEEFLKKGKADREKINPDEIIRKFQSGEIDTGVLSALWESSMKQPPQLAEVLPKQVVQSSPYEEGSKGLIERGLPNPPEKINPVGASLNFRASKPTTDGKLMPAQAAQFYLTTENLSDLFEKLNLDEALANEVQSVAELWAKAETNQFANPEVALSVKSVIIRAKVRKALTDPFGQASLKNLSPDDTYFIIGLDQDPETEVVTIWSKQVEVAPGENSIELSSKDVIYHK